MMSDVGMRSIMGGGGGGGDFREELGNELNALMREQRRETISDREKELNMYRSGSAPPTVEGSLSAVGGLYGGVVGNAEFGLRGGGGRGFGSDEQLRSDPAYTDYYYKNTHLNSRLLKKLAQNQNFNYHPRCEKMKVINLSFADDVLLFSRGDRISLDLLLNQFEVFSSSTGLKANKDKCYLFCAGVSKDEEKSLLDISGFKKGCLPFKYLGVPLDSRKLTIKNCLPLIDRITSKMRVWTTRFLTYAGRL